MLNHHADGWTLAQTACGLWRAMQALDSQPPIVWVWGDLAPLCLCLGRGKWGSVEPLQGLGGPFWLRLAEGGTRLRVGAMGRGQCMG